MPPYRILSLDGGPSAFTIINCLRTVERRAPGFLAAVDMFVGSSAGTWTFTYLAAHMDQVDSGAKSSLELLDDCHTYLEQVCGGLMPTTESPEALLGFLLGRTPFTDYSAIEETMGNVYSNRRMSSLPRRLVILAARATAPWGPDFHDSKSAEHAAERVVDVALKSAAFPIYVATDGGQVDGAMFCNNPAMVGVGRAVAGAAGAAPVALDSIRLLTLGGDWGTSDFSRSVPSGEPPPWPLPGLLPGQATNPTSTRRTAGSSAPDRAEIVGIEKQLTGLEGVLGGARSRFQELLQRDTDSASPVLSPRLRDATLGAMDALYRRTMEDAIRLRESLDQGARVPAQLSAPTGARGDHAWGWGAWLLDPESPLFLLKVMVTNEGRGTAQIAEDLVGRHNVLRLAPVCLLPAEVLALIARFSPDYVKALTTLAAITSGLWSLGLANYSPNVDETMDWIAQRWT